MKRPLLFLFLSATVVMLAAATTAFGQAAPQNEAPPRILHGHTTAGCQHERGSNLGRSCHHDPHVGLHHHIACR